MAGDELVTILGAELAPATLANIGKFKAGIASVASSLKTLALVATGMATAAGLMINRAVDQAAALQNLSDKTGVSTTSLQEWSYAAGQVGVDAKAVEGDLVSLTKSMSSPIPGQFNVNLAMLGVSARDASGALKDSGQVLEDLGDKLAGMSTQRAMQWGSKVGISDDTVLLLRQGSEGIAKLRAEAHELGAIIPEDSIKRAAEFKTQINSLRAVLGSLTSQIAIATLPALSRVVETFKAWVTENRRWIALHTASFMAGLVTAFERVWGAIRKVFEVFSPLVSWFDRATEGISRTDMYTHLLTGALTGLLIILSPIIAKLAAIGAAALAVSAAIEDVFGYFNGEDSATGYILDKIAEKFPGIARWFGLLKDAAVALFEGAIGPGRDALIALGEAFGFVLGSAMSFLDSVYGRMADFFEGFTSRFPALTEAIGALGSLIKSALGGALDFVVAALDVLFDAATKVFGWLFSALEKGLGGINRALEWMGFGAGDREAAKGGESTRPIAADATRYGDAPAATPSPALVRAGQDIIRPTTTLTPGGMGGGAPIITDNRTTIQHINTTDPVQAGTIAAQRAGGSYTQLNTPGLMAPVVR